MMSRPTAARLLAGVAHSACALATFTLAGGGQALAQGRAAPAAASQPDMLGEVVVTATRQADTVSHVAMTVAAVTQKALDQQNIKTVQDLARDIPAVTFRRAGGDNNPSITIRGISSQLGAQTTAVYLDDTPLTKRGTIGLITGNGSATPILYDLERVEVLKGPQGTLFGASSEGGTLRFITPQPSLTKYSASARADVSFTEGGGMSYEGGGAIGGPIIEDKLGFRASVLARHTGGYIDHVSIYDASTVEDNSNWGEQDMARLAVTWQPTAKLKITPSFYFSKDYSNDIDTFYLPIPKFTVNPGVFTNVVTLGTGANRFTFDFPDKAYAGGTYGPFPQFGYFKSGLNTYLDDGHEAQAQHSKRNTVLYLPSLSLDYDAGYVQLKSVTSYIYDNTTGPVESGGAFTGPNYAPAGGSFDAAGNYRPCTATQASGCASAATYVIPGTNTPVPGGFGANPLFWNGVPTQYKEYVYYNKHKAWTEELRFSHNSPGDRLSWVGGVYHNSSSQRQPGSTLSTDNQVIQAIRGIDEGWAAGIPPLSGSIFNPGSPQAAQVSYKILSGPVMVGGVPTYQVIQTAPTPASAGTDASRRLATLDESEIAVFAELNYMVTDKLKVTAGVRASDLKTAYTQTQSGPIYGVPLNLFTPTPTHPFPNQVGDPYNNTGSGSLDEKPVNPKFGLSYQLTPQDLFYFTAAKGYRPGSINTPGTLAQCVNDIAALGGPTPLTYKSDSVWSYEGGAKVRLFDNRVAMNMAVYHIDWTDPQLTVNLRCGFSYVTNGKTAVSNGVDIDGQIRAFPGFTINYAIGYDDAHYDQDFTFKASDGSTSYIVKKGQPLGVPTWQYNVGAQYDFQVLGRAAFVRGDYQFSGDYVRGYPGTPGYNAVIYRGQPTHFATLRAGVNLERVDVALYVNNLTDSRDFLNYGNGLSSPLRTATTFRPREIGMQLNYRY
jgi:outer membrane receptor protein involved in Fe transport